MNIFARELVLILGKHQKELGHLFALRVYDPYTGVDRQISPTKVTRLKRSLSEDITAMLNADELDALQDWVPLDEDEEEVRRLRAALLAEAVRHLLAGRMTGTLASQLGELTLQLLLGQQGDLLTLRDTLLEGVRGAHPTDAHERQVVRGADAEPPLEAGSSAEEQIERVLDAAAEAYAQGALWLEIARDTPDRGARQGYTALARSLFTRAQELATHAPSAAQHTAQQRDLLAAIEAARADAETLG